MRLPFSSRFLGTLAAAAVALTAFTAVPVYADDDRTARTLATILGLAIVGKIIHDERQDKKRKKKEKQAAAPKPRVDPPLHQHRHGNIVHRHADGQYRHSHSHSRTHTPAAPKARPLPRRVDRKLLPQQCFRSYRTYDGAAYMFARRCLERSYDFAHRLPTSCARRIDTTEGPRRGFDARCLRRNGYSLARG